VVAAAAAMSAVSTVPSASATGEKATSIAAAVAACGPYSLAAHRQTTPQSSTYQHRLTKRPLSMECCGPRIRPGSAWRATTGSSPSTVGSRRALAGEDGLSVGLQVDLRRVYRYPQSPEKDQVHTQNETDHGHGIPPHRGPGHFCFVLSSHGSPNAVCRPRLLPPAACAT